MPAEEGLRVDEAALAQRRSVSVLLRCERGENSEVKIQQTAEALHEKQSRCTFGGGERGTNLDWVASGSTVASSLVYQAGNIWMRRHIQVRWAGSWAAGSVCVDSSRERPHALLRLLKSASASVLDRSA